VPGEVIRGGSLAKYEKIKLDNVLGDQLPLIASLDLITMGFGDICLRYTFNMTTYIVYLSANMRNFNFEAFSKGWIFKGFVTGLVLFFLLIILFRNRIRQSLVYLKVKNFVKGILLGIKSIRKNSTTHPIYIVQHIDMGIVLWDDIFLHFTLSPPTAGLGATSGFYWSLCLEVFGNINTFARWHGHLSCFSGSCAGYLSRTGRWTHSAMPILSFFNIQILTTIVFGILSLIFLPINNRHYIPNHFF
jgi:hypothetical protein